MADTTPQPGLLSIPEVAEQLGVNTRHIRRLVHERRIPFVKWGHLIRFKPGDIDAWIDANRIALNDFTRRAITPQPVTTDSPRSRPREDGGPTVTPTPRGDSQLRFDS